MSYVLPKSWIELVPSLVVEVVSPNETVYELTDKVNDFQSVNTPLIWVIVPEARQATVYRADGTVSLVSDAGELSGENVLPGFVMPLAAVLPPLVPTTL